MPYNFTAVEKKWQQHWAEHRTFRAYDPADAGAMPKVYVLDMFPYPSGSGLHVGHPEGYTATDITSRYLRMKGFNVLYAMGWDAFGLPAEQYAVKTNTHPAVTTRQNIDNFRRQIQSLGLSYDWDREIDTTSPAYFRWTQWIFLQIYNSYFDPVEKKAKPIAHLVQELMNENLVIAPDGTLHTNPTQEGMERVAGEVRIERLWRELSPEEQRDLIDSQRLAYTDEVAVNWCPQLGTVLANEEVIDGKSEVGGFPVDRRPMRQWLLRITAYADRLIDDLDGLKWPDSIKEMQRNWIGRSIGAEVDFDVAPPDPAARRDQRVAGSGEDELDDLTITVFTTRPDTLYGATYMVLAPEHPLVDRITLPNHRESVEAYRTSVAGKSERDRLADVRDKTGVFTGSYALNPANNARIPIYLADYVLMGYGTGAIMAVPAHDQRDYDFARKFDLPIVPVVRPASGSAAPGDRAFEDEGVAINSPGIDDLPTAQAREAMTEILQRDGTGIRSVKYKLRDWLFSRQRYWGEPFPIVLDEEGNHYPLPETALPVTLPEMEDFKPTGTPEPPLSKAKAWLKVELDGRTYSRETNTMPQWAGSSWYYLRYADPQNADRMIDPAKEKYWMPVDLYVGGVEHAVLHLLYARFWHKVLFDLGHVSTPEPFNRLVNQGLILGEAEYHLFETPGGVPVTASAVRDIGEEATPEGPKVVGYLKTTGERLIGRRVGEDQVTRGPDGFYLKDLRDDLEAELHGAGIMVDARSFKMSKSRGNVVNPDEIVRDYGADCLRLYEMYLGPLEAQKPWNTRDIIGMSRFLNAVWRNLVGDEENNRTAKLDDAPPAEPLDRLVHRTVKKVGADIESMRFNTAIAELIKLNNELGRLESIPRPVARTFTLLLAPFAPHLAEEVWQRLGHNQSLAREAWPTFDPAKLVESTIELPVQVNGKLRGRITVPADAAQDAILSAAESAAEVTPWLTGKQIKKRIYVPGKLVSFVVA